MDSKTTTLAVAALLLAAAGSATAVRANKPTVSDQSDRLVLGNAEITVELQGKKPLLHVRDAGNASRSFTVDVQRLVEVTPGNPVTGRDDVASFRLSEAANWTVTHAEDATGLTLAMHREGPLDVRPHAGPGPGPIPPVPLPGAAGNATGNGTGDLPGSEGDGNASITLMFHLYASPQTLRAGNATVNVTTHEVKFDLIVERWDWVSRGDLLALVFHVTPAEGANATHSGADAEEVGVEGNGTRLGWFGWVPHATATTNGTSQEIRVTEIAPGSAAENRGAEHRLLYEAPGFDRLVHDPTVGIAPADGGSTAAAASSGTQAVPGFGGVLLFVGVAAGAAVVATRADRRNRR